MEIKELQKQVDDMISSYKLGYYNPMEMMTQLIEETGEVARAVNILYGPKNAKDGETVDLGEEIADVIFVLACLANSKGIDLEKEWEKKMNHRTERDKNRWERK